MCPLSNIKLCVFQKMQDHNIKKLMHEGLYITVNSDDPAYFGGYVSDNYHAVSNALALKRQDIIALARNGFIAAMMTETQRQAALADFDATVATLGAT